MRRFIFLTVFSLVLSSQAAFAQESAEAPSGTSETTMPVQIHGDSVEYFHEEQKAVGTGNVSIEYEDTTLTADKITVYMDTKNAIAEGNVKLVQKGSEFTGERGEYNFDTKVGNVSKMKATIEPFYYGSAEKIERVDQSHYKAVNSTLTTCCGDNPFYQLKAQQVDIYPGQKVVARNALLLIKGVPVFFLPFWEQYLYDRERAPVQIIPGHSSDWGAFVLTKWRYRLVDRPDLHVRGNILADYRSKKGFGGGVETFYNGDKVGQGAARVYYANDKEPSEHPDEIGPDRYRVQWRHQMPLTEDTTLTTELNKLSDEFVIKDYFYREEYEQDVLPDNYVSIITAKPNYTLSILDRERMDDFFTVVERSPEIRFDTHNQQFLDTPFYLRQESQFTNLRKEFANSKGDLATTRYDSNETLTYAGRVGDLSITPHAGMRHTYYSRGVNPDEKDLVRGIFDGGVDFSTRFYKTYDTTIKAFGLDYNQIRHVFAPVASYNYRPNPTVSRQELQQFDALDSLDKQNFWRFSFENKFFTKHHEGPDLMVTREIARVVPFFDVNYDTHRVDNVGYDVDWRPYKWLAFESDASFDTITRDFDAANFDIGVNVKDLDFRLGHRFIKNESAQTTAEIDWKINEEWSLSVYDRFEFEQGSSKEFEVTLSKAFECTILDFTYNHKPDEDSFYFVFRLKAFPTASFGLSQTYRGPKSSSYQRNRHRL